METTQTHKIAHKSCVLVAFALIFSLFVLSACDFTGSAAPPPRVIEEPQRTSDQLIREDFLYDFDYLMDVLKENAPYFSLIYRRNGVDMLALMPELRTRIAYEMPHVHFLSFYNVLRNDFFYHAFPVTHMWLLSYPEMTRIGILDVADNLEGIRRQQYLLRAIPQVWHGPWLSPYIEAAIIESGRIAYISIPTFSDEVTPELIQDVDDFYREIEDFAHLIIDLRGNPGGFTSFFDDVFMSPLIGDPLQATFYHFMQGGGYNIAHALNSGFDITDLRRFSVNSLNRLFPDVEVSQEVIDDLSIMAFYFSETWTVYPNTSRSIDFNGRIWILTDDFMTSASHIAAAFYRDAEFVTLVGDTTGGMFVHYDLNSILFQLPRTGLFVRIDTTYVLDSNGRPVDYGIDPHYFNLPDMDALETVLELIRRGG